MTADELYRSYYGTLEQLTDFIRGQDDPYDILMEYVEQQKMKTELRKEYGRNPTLNQLREFLDGDDDDILLDWIDQQDLLDEWQGWLSSNLVRPRSGA